jgi:hypothetical protein
LFESRDMGFDDVSRSKTQQEPHADEDDDHVIKLAYDGYEIRDQIDRHGQVEDKAWRDQADSQRYSPVASQSDGQSELALEPEPQDALDELSIRCVDRSPQKESDSA